MPGCGGALHPIGETTSEMLDWVPASLRIIRTRRHLAREAVRPVALAAAQPPVEDASKEPRERRGLGRYRRVRLTGEFRGCAYFSAVDSAAVSSAFVFGGRSPVRRRLLHFVDRRRTASSPRMSAPRSVAVAGSGKGSGSRASV